MKLRKIAVTICVLLTITVTTARANDEVYEQLKIFADVIKLVEDTYVDPVDGKKIIQGAIRGLLKELDPHSAFFTSEAFADFMTDTSGSFEGIGIHIGMKDGRVIVVSPIEDTPAFKAGLKTNDIITKVDGKPVSGLQDAINKMRGTKGTKLTVTIVRADVEDPIEFEMVRDKIPIKTVKSITLKPGYGYLRLTQFSGDSAHDMRRALEKLEANKVPLKGLILDLRNNGGGLLNQSVEIADLFLEEGRILSIKGRKGTRQKPYWASVSKVKREYPLIVLINGGSASASEIVAGALQDQKRALILGTTSLGKGSVQSVERSRDGSGIKLTIARYYTPNGRSIQAKGIDPDIFLKYKLLTPDELKDEGLQKESDLKNHLEIQGKNNDQKTMSPKKFGLLDVEKLLLDNHIRRALETFTIMEVGKNLK